MRFFVPFWFVILLLTASCGQQEGKYAARESEHVATPPVLISGVADSIYEEAMKMPPTVAEADSLSLTESCGNSLSQVGRRGDSLSQVGRRGDSFVVLADVVPDIIQEIRYYSTFNFVGRRIPGYEAPIAILTRRAADSLKLVSDELVAKGYRLKVFDAYRPQRAVLYFIGWARHSSDTLMKQAFYPNIPKDSLFVKGYLSSRSAHARGSTIDLTLFDMRTEREVDMGGPYDLLDTISQFYYRDGLTPDQIRHRHLLRESMMRHGFKPVRTEWWHFQLKDEPYPTQSFDFPVR